MYLKRNIMKKLITLLFVLGLIINVNGQQRLITPPQKNIQPHEWRMFPKPLEIKKKGNKVIVVFDRKEFERFQFFRKKRYVNINQNRFNQNR